MCVHCFVFLFCFVFRYGSFQFFVYGSFAPFHGAIMPIYTKYIYAYLRLHFCSMQINNFINCWHWFTIFTHKLNVARRRFDRKFILDVSGAFYLRFLTALMSTKVNFCMDHTKTKVNQAELIEKQSAGWNLSNLLFHFFVPFSAFDCSFSLCFEKRTVKYQHYMLSITVACPCQYGSALNSHQVCINHVAIAL